MRAIWNDKYSERHDEALIIVAFLEEPNFLTATSTHWPTLWAVLSFIAKKCSKMGVSLYVCKYIHTRQSFG